MMWTVFTYALSALLGGVVSGMVVYLCMWRSHQELVDMVRSQNDRLEILAPADHISLSKAIDLIRSRGFDVRVRTFHTANKYDPPTRQLVIVGLTIEGSVKIDDGWVNETALRATMDGLRKIDIGVAA